MSQSVNFTSAANQFIISHILNSLNSAEECGNRVTLVNMFLVPVTTNKCQLTVGR